MPELVVVAEQVVAAVPGGTGRYTAELLRALAETAPPGWTVGSVVARHADVTPARVEGVAGPRVLPVLPRALVAAWQAGVPLWPGGPDGVAVHAPTPLAPPRAGRGRSLSVTVHDTVPWTHPETLTPRGVRWHRAVIRRAAARADALVVPTAAVAADLATRVPCRTAPVVVPHGTTALTAPRPAPDGLVLPDRYVLAVGTLEPRKGLDVLVRAMAALADGGPADVPLVVVGRPGWGETDPGRLAAEAGLAPHRLRPLGPLDDAGLATVLAGASALAVPSRAEGFGLPVVEAMAAGVPVVHSDAPALVEVAGGAGLVCPRGDADALAARLREVLADPERARHLAEAGRRRARRFSWRRAAEAVWALHRRDRTGRRIPP